MNNILIDTHLFAVMPFDDISRFTTSEPERIGDDSCIIVKSTYPVTNITEGIELQVRLLSKNDKYYLVDFHNLKAWEYPFKEK